MTTDSGTPAKAPGASETPTVADVLEVPDGRDEGEATPVPAAPEDGPARPDAVEAPEATEEAEAPETPGVSDPQEEPEASEASGAPEVSEVTAECPASVGPVGESGPVEARSGEAEPAGTGSLGAEAAETEAADTGPGDEAAPPGAGPYVPSPRTGTGTPHRPSGEDLAAVARSLSGTAGAIRDVGRVLTAVAADPALLGSLGRSPRRGARALYELARTLVAPAGLGYAPDGRGAARAARLGGVLTSRASLAVDVAVTALKLRIRLCAARHPEFVEEGPVRRMLIAVEADKQLLALRILRENVRAWGGARTLAALAPCLAEVLAWNALVDENPFNDEAAWHIVQGTRADGDPLLGTRLGAWARWDRGAGRAVAEPLDPELLAGFDNGGGVTGHLRNLAAIGNDGRMIVQRVKAPDGVTRYVVLLPGMALGLPRNPTPQDLVGAVTAVGRNDSPYTRAVRKALALTVPDGAEIALVGHSQGGIAAMNLTELGEVNDRWRLARVVAVGSPIDFKRPRDPRTKVVSLVNEHDVVPNLEGRSPASVFPVPADWLEFTWVDPTHDFPQCHNVDVYAQSLDKVVPEARDRVDDLLAPFRGHVEETFVLRLHDR
ncbi:hypothetical protein [Streptomyces albireticuli]|uniref:hypothetical protein n=1 Tax=Streptomyces albireticuli TaxID=1940 RepID=UPI001E2DBF04|nr:hypothetical protein [Streptomyces albireticuli]MCD9143158.1 hypothetical protein [Streptomyces albireticuli]MCD9163600.1 hypothetical protein [Streptomyces albireticuli]MCD9191275.1 hypothetical protein [Streptomyces albireticuli]